LAEVGWPTGDGLRTGSPPLLFGRRASVRRGDFPPIPPTPEM